MVDRPRSARPSSSRVNGFLGSPRSSRCTVNGRNASSNRDDTHQTKARVPTGPPATAATRATTRCGATLVGRHAAAATARASKAPVGRTSPAANPITAHHHQRSLRAASNTPKARARKRPSPYAQTNTNADGNSDSAQAARSAVARSAVSARASRNTNTVATNEATFATKSSAVTGPPGNTTSNSRPTST